MELRNTEELSFFIRDEIHIQRTNVSAVCKKAKVSQPSLQRFLKENVGLSTFTFFPVLEALGKRVIVEDAKKTPYEMSDLDVSKEYSVIGSKPKPSPTKQSLSTELRNRIEEYKSDTSEDKPKFSVDLIIEFLEESYDKLATI